MMCAGPNILVFRALNDRKILFRSRSCIKLLPVWHCTDWRLSYSMSINVLCIDARQRSLRGHLSGPGGRLCPIEFCLWPCWG